MQMKVNEQFPISFEEYGTYISSDEHGFIAVLADEKWSDKELNLFKNKKALIQVVNQNEQLIFLVTVDGVIETSDFYFNIHDQDEFKRHDCYAFALVLLDKTSKICGLKTMTLSKAMSQTINELLDAQQTKAYSEEESLRLMEALQDRYEPFELQPFALCEESH